VQSLGLQVCQRLVCCPNRLPHTDAAQIRWAISQFLADEKMMPHCAPPPTARRGTTPVGNWKRILRAVIVECTTTRCKGNALPHSAKSILRTTIGTASTVRSYCLVNASWNQR
jgi:hypothetical protein